VITVEDIASQSSDVFETWHDAIFGFIFPQVA